MIICNSYLFKKNGRKVEKNEPIIGRNLEILDVAKTIAKEKGISSDEVLEAMEVAIAKAGRTKYGLN